MNLERDNIGPVLDPRVEQSPVVALHDLEALTKVVGDPAVHVSEAGRGQPPSIAEAAVDGNRITVAEPLYDQEEHAWRLEGKARDYRLSPVSVNSPLQQPGQRRTMVLVRETLERVMRRIRPELCRCFAAVAMLTALATSTSAQQARGSGLPPRDEWQRVPEILAALGVAEGQRVADVAAGQGYLTKPLARRVGTSGRVYAVEIGEEPLRALRELVQRDSLSNVEVIAGTEMDPRLPAKLDGAVILNSYHEITEYAAILEAIKRALRPGGLLVLVDNMHLPGQGAAREEQARRHAIDPSFVDAELRAAGFEIADRQDAFIVQPFPQWLIVARRPLEGR